MSGPPYSYEELNLAAASVNPSTVHTSNTEAFHYYFRYLMQYAISQFKWTLPETWDPDYFLYVLYCRGYLAVINTDRFGVIPQQCTLRGLNVFYHPTEAIIANPLLPSGTVRKINNDCVIIKLQPDYRSICDKIALYADQMALCDEVMQVNLYNSQLSYVMAAGNKAAAESFKKLYDIIHSGNPAVVIDKNLFDADGNPTWQPFDKDVKSSFIVDQIQTVKEHLKDQLLTELGIPNANTLKKERLVVAEVESNGAETAILPDMWLEHIKAECKRANEMFNLNISVEWRFDPKKGGIDNASDNDNSGIV